MRSLPVPGDYCDDVDTFVSIFRFSTETSCWISLSVHCPYRGSIFIRQQHSQSYNTPAEILSNASLAHCRSSFRLSHHSDVLWFIYIDFMPCARATSSKRSLFRARCTLESCHAVRWYHAHARRNETENNDSYYFSYKPRPSLHSLRAKGSPTHS